MSFRNGLAKDFSTDASAEEIKSIVSIPKEVRVRADDTVDRARVKVI